MDDQKPPRVPATAPANWPQKYDAKSLRVALADRLTLSEAVEQVARLLDQWPNGRKGVADGYIGALAAVLADYPRCVALRCCNPLKGVARATDYLPTIATVVAFCERETAALRGIVDGDDHEKRIQAEMARRREEERPRAQRETLAQLRERHGANWGLKSMDDADAAAAKGRHLDAVRNANKRAYEKIGGTVSSDILITDALREALKPDPQP